MKNNISINKKLTASGTNLIQSVVDLMTFSAVVVGIVAILAAISIPLSSLV